LPPHQIHRSPVRSLQDPGIPRIPPPRRHQRGAGMNSLTRFLSGSSFSLSHCLLVSLALLMLATGCWKEDMGTQPKAKPMQEISFFPDATTARPLPIGAIPRGGTSLDAQL